MDKVSLILGRISECASHPSPTIGMSLAHAYVGCLSSAQLAEGMIRTLGGDKVARSAILNRLSRLGADGNELTMIDDLGNRLLGLTVLDAKAMVQVDTILSRLYAHFKIPTRHMALQRWRARGTDSAASRWLKALTGDEALFDIRVILSYWRIRQDWRAAAVLAKRASPAMLTQLLPELVENCDEGWIVSRAALLADKIDSDTWAKIREEFPVSYIYLCSKLRRPISADEAYLIVEEADAFNERGLAIWSIGQMGMWDVLDRIKDNATRIELLDLERLGVRITPDERLEAHDSLAE